MLPRPDPNPQAHRKKAQAMAMPMRIASWLSMPGKVLMRQRK